MKSSPLSILLAATAIWAAGDTTNLPADWQLGRTLELPDARSLALGGVSAAIGSPFGFLTNPALAVTRFDRFNAPVLPETRLRPTVGLAGNLTVGAEKRTRTIFDYYNNAIGELSVADNTGVNPLAGPFAVQMPLGGVGLGLGMRPSRDYTYHFRQEVRDEFYHLIRANEENVTGQVDQAGAAVAYDLANLVSAGIGLSYGFGERVLDSVVNDTLSTINRVRISGLALNGGLLFHPGSALRIGLSVEPRLNGLSKAFVKSGDSSVVPLDNPTRAVLGFNYLVAAAVPTGIYLQAGYTAWHDLDTASLHSTIDLRAGVEHRLLSNLDLRYGFGLLPSPLDPGTQAGMVSLGVGLQTNLAQIDLGGSLTRRMFGNGPLLPNQAIGQRIYQTGWQVALSIERGF